MVAELTSSSNSPVRLCDGTGTAVVMYWPIIDFRTLSALGDNIPASG